MKKFLLSISIILCISMGAACFAACNSKTKWVCPEFYIENQGYTVEHVTNMQEDFEFPIEGVKLNHSNFQTGIFEYAWVIKNSNGEVVGWIDVTSRGYDRNNGKYKYGFSTSNANGVYGFGIQSICIILKADYLSIFDTLTINSNYGEVSKTQTDNNPFWATERYPDYDEATNQVKYLEGAEDFVCCNYEIDFTGVDANKVESIKINLNIPDLIA